MVATYLIYALIGYFIMAVVNLVDKFFLEDTIPNSLVYTFFVGIFGAVVFGFIPFGVVSIPQLPDLTLMLFVGALFIPTWNMFYKALQAGEASRVIPLLGSALPIFSLVLSLIFLGDKFSLNELYGFAFLVAGGTLIAITKPEKKVKSYRWIWLSLMAALLFSTFFVLSDYIYSRHEFITGFFWPRIGTFIIVLFFLFHKSFRQQLGKIIKKASPKKRTAFIGNQGLGGLGFLFINLALLAGPVALVNALQAFQFVFVLLLAIVISVKKPQLLKEQISPFIVAEKIIAIGLIAIGLFFIT